MRLSQVRDFVAVAELGSLRAASRCNGVSQPAITKSIQQLEAELNAQLLHRTSQGAVPTPAGRVFLARARAIQAELRKALDELAPYSGDHSRGGTVAIGVSPTAGTLLIADTLRSLHAQYPRCSVHVVEGVWSTLQPLVRDATLDFAVTVKTPDARVDSNIRFKPLYRAEMIVAGRRGHPLGRARSLRELGGQSWMVFGPPGQGGLLEQYFERNGLPTPRAAVQCESFAAAMALLVRTDMLGLVARHLLDDPQAGKLLQPLPLAEVPPPVTVGAISRLGAPMTPVATAAARSAELACRRLVRTHL